jgi:hypothetical protein
LEDILACHNKEQDNALERVHFEKNTAWTIKLDSSTIQDVETVLNDQIEELVRKIQEHRKNPWREKSVLEECGKGTIWPY